MGKMFQLLLLSFACACTEKDEVFEASFYECKSGIESNNLQHPLANAIDGLGEDFYQ